MVSRLPPIITEQSTLPLIAAPMFLVSGVEMVLAACYAGIVGSFPAPNTRTIEDLDRWMEAITSALAEARRQHPDHKIAPWAFNMIVHRSYTRRAAELELVLKYQPPIVITALGSPRDLVDAVHGYGGLVYADVNSVRYARKSAEVGVDGLVLVAAGAGGHTGQMTGFAFVDAVREFWDGTLILGGGISTGRAIRAAQTLGADLAYMGTRFIATRESMANDSYKQMLIDATIEDIVQSDGITGVMANWLRPSLEAAGYNLKTMKKQGAINLGDPSTSNKAWRDTWSAGQGVDTIKHVQSMAELVADLRAEYRQAIQRERNGSIFEG